MGGAAEHTRAVVEYYERTRAEYRVLWRSRRTLGLHFGYYEGAHTTHEAAVRNTNAQLAAQIGIHAGDVVLDAGCGLGGSAIWLAGNVGCEVVGVSNVPHHVERARRNASRHGVGERVRFVVRDFADTGLENGSITVFWGIESVVHAFDKQAVLHEAHRVLGTGGRLALVEYVLAERAFTPRERECFATWQAAWAMPALHRRSEYERMLDASGFEDVSFHDWTTQAGPSFARLDALGRTVEPVAPVLSRLRLVNRTQRRNLAATRAMLELLRGGAWRYQVVSAAKRAPLG